MKYFINVYEKKKKKDMVYCYTAILPCSVVFLIFLKNLSENPTKEKKKKLYQRKSSIIRNVPGKSSGRKNENKNIIKKKVENKKEKIIIIQKTSLQVIGTLIRQTLE